MAQILGVYKEIEILNAAAASAKEASDAVVIVSYADPLAKEGTPGDRRDGAGLAAETRHPCQLRPRSRR
jgi:hypothetical protein